MAETENSPVDRPPEVPFVDLATASDEELAGAGKSRMFFPLRGGVELFSDRAMPEAAARAKQASVLYDEVVFEPGLYEVSIAEGGSNDWWIPPADLKRGQLGREIRMQEPGTNFSVAMGLEGGHEMVSMIDSPLVVEYASEYHTGILNELASFAPGWVKVATLGGNPFPMSTEPGEFWRRQQRADQRDEALMPEARRGPGRYKRNWIIKAFNQDAVASSIVGASFNPTSLFAPIARHRAGDLATDPPRDGRTALEVLAPDLSGLPWETVLEFRDHPGSVEARAMLREFEEKAAEEEPADARAFFRGVQAQVTGALLWMIEGTRVPLPERMATEVVKQAVGIFPVVGQIAGAGLAAAELATEWHRGRHSWTAALMVLRRRP